MLSLASVSPVIHVRRLPRRRRPQSRRSAVPPRARTAGHGGRRTGRNGRRTRAVAVGAARHDYCSFGGARGRRAARSVAAAAIARPPRGRQVRASCARDVATVT